MRDAANLDKTPWAMSMRATAIAEPGHLVQVLMGAILGCGGWVLSRGATDTGIVTMLFEFERRDCIDIYSLLIAAGLELSQASHIRFTELCQCVLLATDQSGSGIAGIDLEIQTTPTKQPADKLATGPLEP